MVRCIRGLVLAVTIVGIVGCSAGDNLAAPTPPAKPANTPPPAATIGVTDAGRNEASGYIMSSSRR